MVDKVSVRPHGRTARQDEVRSTRLSPSLPTTGSWTSSSPPRQSTTSRQRPPTALPTRLLLTKRSTTGFPKTPSCCCAPAGAPPGPSCRRTWGTTRRATRATSPFRASAKGHSPARRGPGGGSAGVDTASTDYGRSADFPSAALQVAGLENLTSVDTLPPRGFTVIAMPNEDRRRLRRPGPGGRRPVSGMPPYRPRRRPRAEPTRRAYYLGADLCCLSATNRWETAP